MREMEDDDMFIWEDPIQLYQKLGVWEKSHRLTLAVYELTLSFPKEELFGITSQLRRSAASVGLNIVEGNARGSTKDYIRFLIMARASCQEVHYLIFLSRDLNYVKPEKANQILSQIEEIGRMLNALVSALKTKIKNG